MVRNSWVFDHTTFDEARGKMSLKGNTIWVLIPFFSTHLQPLPPVLWNFSSKKTWPSKKSKLSPSKVLWWCFWVVRYVFWVEIWFPVQPGFLGEMKRSPRHVIETDSSQTTFLPNENLTSACVFSREIRSLPPPKFDSDFFSEKLPSQYERIVFQQPVFQGLC